MNKASYSKIGRSWVYLRGGYSVYFSFFVGVGNSLMIAYFVVLTGTDCPLDDDGLLCTVRPYIPNFAIFTLIAVAVGAPMMMIVGRFHFKKQLFRSEMEVTWQNNPYYFKLIGHQKIVFQILNEILEEIKIQNKFDKNKIANLEALQNKIKFLINGGSVKEEE